MSVTVIQIRYLASFFTDAQLTELFGATPEDIQLAFSYRPRLVAQILSLPVLVERVIKASEHLVMIAHLIEGGCNPTFEEMVSKLAQRVDELDLSVRSVNILQNGGIEYIWQLASMTKEEYLKLKNCGRKSYNEIKELLADIGLALGMAKDGPLILEAKLRTEIEVAL